MPSSASRRCRPEYPWPPSASTEGKTRPSSQWRSWPCGTSVWSPSSRAPRGVEEMGRRGLADAGRMMFDANAFIGEQREAIRKSVPGKAIIACSRGGDSTAAAVLASRALGDRLLAVYIDTGLMRKGETEDVAEPLKELGVRHRIVFAADEFFAALRGIVDPEKKRSG